MYKKIILEQKIYILTISILTCIGLIYFCITEEFYAPNFMNKNMAPSVSHLFGTDWLGRDMFFRTLKGLSFSVIIGLIAAVCSAVIALIIGISAAVFPKWVDSVIGWLIDLDMGIPHIMLMILISFAVGKGVLGVIIGISVTHWPLLARIIRAECLSLKSEHYVTVSKMLGKGNLYIIRKHYIPYLFPQFMVGLVMLFPHAILHEAAITFLGFGLPPEQPAIGLILSESMRYLSIGMWWLSFFPGLCLVTIVILFDKLGDYLKGIISSKSHVGY